MNDPIEPALHVHRFGDRALHVDVGDQRRVQQLIDALTGALEDGRAEDVIAGDGNLLVVFDGSSAGERRARGALREAVKLADDRAWIGARRRPRRIVIPVRYGGVDGPDLGDAAAIARCTEADLVRRHVQGEYTVRFIGFAPGFPYIGDLAPEIAVPRLATPRTTTRAGSVAIAERYTGIYPTELPGGWRVIGWTRVSTFDPTMDPPVRLLPGDIVRFEAE